jgi:hypothetical protein
MKFIYFDFKLAKNILFALAEHHPKKYAQKTFCVHFSSKMLAHQMYTVNLVKWLNAQQDTIAYQHLKK